mgnify:CR=1 FL=1
MAGFGGLGDAAPDDVVVLGGAGSVAVLGGVGSVAVLGGAGSVAVLGGAGSVAVLGGAGSVGWKVVRDRSRNGRHRDGGEVALGERLSGGTGENNTAAWGWSCARDWGRKLFQ